MPDSETLARFGALAQLTPRQRATVADIGHDVAYAARQLLFDEGQEAQGCWLIRSGRVALETDIPGRGAVVIQTLGTGDVLGWSWLVAPHRWHFRAVALEPVEALQLDTHRLRAMADEDPALGYPLAMGMFEALLNRLQSTRARLLDLYGNPRER